MCGLLLAATEASAAESNADGEVRGADALLAHTAQALALPVAAVVGLLQAAALQVSLRAAVAALAGTCAVGLHGFETRLLAVRRAHTRATGRGVGVHAALEGKLRIGGLAAALREGPVATELRATHANAAALLALIAGAPEELATRTCAEEALREELELGRVGHAHQPLELLVLGRHGLLDRLRDRLLLFC